MSAKKASSSTANKSAATPHRKSPASARGTNSSASPKTSERTLSNKDIGEVAGEIWSLLATGDDQTLAAIKKSIDAPSDVVVAAVGWLAREDNLEFVTSGRGLKLALRR